MKNESTFPQVKSDYYQPDYGGEPGRLTNVYSEGGLTKREWFAGLAMQGILTTLSSDKANDAFMLGAKASNRTPEQAMAAVAVMQADALIAELERKEE